jgi:flagellar motor component MotA
MIQWNAELSRRLSCTAEEKAGLVPVIRRFLDLAATYRSEGMSALEATSRGFAEPLFSVGIRLMAEGVSGETLEDIMATYLAVSQESGYPFLQSCVIAEGILGLSSGEEPAVLVRRLAAYFGAEDALPLLEELETVSAPAREHP